MQTDAENPNATSESSEQQPDDITEQTGGTGTRPKTTEMIERFKRFHGFRFDTDVARKLDLSDGSAIGNWRRRDSIDILLIADYCPEINMDWLIWGRGTRTPPPMEERKDIPDNVLYLQEMGVPREQIIEIVNEALENYLGSKKRSEQLQETSQGDVNISAEQEEESLAEKENNDNDIGSSGGESSPAAGEAGESIQENIQ